VVRSLRNITAIWIMSALFGLFGSASASIAPGSWSILQQSSDMHNAYTSSLLPNGNILVVGGYSTEIYDPINNDWTYTSDPESAYHGHLSVGLADGRVLVMGGYFSFGAELYNPFKGIWSRTGSMIGFHTLFSTATLLSDGKVLVVGKEQLEGSDAEVYDPASGTWSATGSMAAGRYGHTATLLKDGRVLVAGGDSNGVISGAELYDPVTGTWSETSPMYSARAYHTATLLDNGKVLVVGGVSGGVILSGAELFDPTEGTWSETGPLQVGRYDHAAALLKEGLVLVAGGWEDFNVGTKSAELYNPLTGKWVATAPMYTARVLLKFRTVQLSDGSVVTLGYDPSLGDGNKIHGERFAKPVSNDQPSFNGGGTVMVAKDSGAYAAPWATWIAAGPPDEIDQMLTFLTPTTHPELFSVLPEIASDGTLTFTPAAGQTGTAVVTVTLKDDGGTSNYGVDVSAPQTLRIKILEEGPFDNYIPQVRKR